MNVESYARVKRLFQKAVELDTREWSAFLDEECPDDLEVRKEVEVLLENHRPDTILKVKGVLPRRPPARFKHATSAVARGLSTGWERHRRVTVSIIVIITVLLSIGAWVAYRVESTIMLAAETSLRKAVRRNAEIVQLWGFSRNLSVLWARDPEVRHPIGDLLSLEAADPAALREALREHERAAALRAGLAPHFKTMQELQHGETAKYLVFDFQDKEVLAASEEYEGLIGTLTSLKGFQWLEECKRNGPTSQQPYRLKDLLDPQSLSAALAAAGEPPLEEAEPREPSAPEAEESSPAAEQEQPDVEERRGLRELCEAPSLSFTVPLYTGTIERVMEAERTRPDPEAILWVAIEPELRLGGLGEADMNPDRPKRFEEDPSVSFLFDREGTALSNLPCEDLLAGAGLLPGGPGTLGVKLLDPGREIRPGDTRETLGPLDQRTLLVRKAIAGIESSEGETQLVMEPYRDVAGRKVVGAWQWIPEFRMGLATEVDSRLVFDSLDAIKTAETVLLALLIILGAVALHSSMSAETLSLRVSEGEQLGQYILLELIGEGGLGRVYKARHSMLQRITAVKLLRSEIITESALERFAREVRQTSRLTHPNTIAIYDYGRSESGVFYYAMEYLPGISLADLLARETYLPVGRVIYILRQVLGSLAEAHSVGLIHRDIKPANIMLNRRGGQCDVVKVLDFGLVKCIESEDDIALTAEGMISGTPLYIAPDRFRGEQHPDGRSDLYAVGTIAFMMLTGDAPFDAKNRMELCLAVMRDPAPRASVRARQPIPPKLDDLIYAAMAKEPDDRPTDAEAMIEVLEELQAEFPWTRRDSKRWWSENEPDEE